MCYIPTGLPEKRGKTRKDTCISTPKFASFCDTRTQKRAQSENSTFITNCDPVLLLQIVFSRFQQTTTLNLCSFSSLGPQKCSAVPNFTPALLHLLQHRRAVKVRAQQMAVSAPAPRPTCHPSNSLKALNYSICSCSLRRACAL